MKPLIKLSIFLSFLVIGNTTTLAQNSRDNSITGSGNIITNTIKTQPYEILNISGPMEVTLEKGSEGNINVTAEDNVQDRIVIESDGKTLTISMKNNTSLRNTKKIKILVPVEEISAISLNGSGRVESKNMLKTPSLNLSISGSGDINADVAANILKVQLHGSGNIKLSGNAKDAEVKTTGSGNFEGKDLIAENAEVSISGSGDSTIHAKNTLNATILGSGSIFYMGNPDANKVKVRGSGKVRPL